MQETLSAILSPLGTAALVLLLVIFMLLKREDLRGRLIRLVGQGRISTTTRAMEDAGRRVSRSFPPSSSSTRVTAFVLRLGCSLSEFPMRRCGECWPEC